MDELKRTVVAFRTKLADYHEVFFDNEFTGVFDQENNIEAMSSVGLRLCLTTKSKGSIFWG